jgi:hypothetical protein
MRSEPFLQMLKQSMDASLTAREQWNQLFTRAHHDVQAVARQDIDAVLQGMRHLERRLLDGMETVNAQFASLARRIDALEASPADSNDNDVAPAEAE